MFQKLLAKLAKALKKRKIPYMVIGGQAVLLYGEPRMTRDIDITIGAGTEKLGELLGVLKETGLKVIPKKVKEFVEQTFVLPAIDKKTGIRADFIFSFTPYEAAAIKRARKITLAGEKMAFAAPEDVIIHKIFAGRPRDIEDAKSIILKNKKLDTHYLKSRLVEFDAAFPDKKFLKIFLNLSSC